MMWSEIDCSEFTWGAFEDLCKRAGNTPAEFLGFQVREYLANYLDKVETCVDPVEEARRLRLRIALRGFLEHCGPKRDKWPWTDDDQPESLEAAIDAAKARGARMLKGVDYE